MSNPIQYTSRTYSTIIDDINSVPLLADKPLWFKKLIAGLGDLFGVINNASANQAFLDTSFTRQAIADHLELIDYRLTPHQTSYGNIRFYLKKNAVFPVVVSKSELVALTQGSIAASSKRFESRSDVSIAEIKETFIADFTTNKLTVAREYSTGEKVVLSTTGALPAGLSTNTDYWVIKVDATTVKLSTSLLLAKSGSEIPLTDNGTGTNSVILYSYVALCYQQETVSNLTIIGKSDGITEFQEFDLVHKMVLEKTASITINSITWTRVDSLIDSSPLDTHYRLLYNSDGTSFLRFGNGIFGLIPPAFSIITEYSFGGGVNSNSFGVGSVNIYAGANTNLDAVENIEDMTGGEDEESAESAKKLAPILLKAQSLFVTTSSGVALSLSFGGVQRVKINKNVYGLLSAQVVIVPTGGGTASPTLISELQTYLIDRTILESMDIRVFSATYFTVNVTSSFKVKSGFLFSEIKEFYELAEKLFFSETTNEIKSILLSSGVESATTFINGKFGYSFGTNSDLAQIKKLIENVSSADFGRTVQSGDLNAYLDTFVDGVDYLILTLPVFPVVTTSAEITTDGAMTTTEI